MLNHLLHIVVVLTCIFHFKFVNVVFALPVKLVAKLIGCAV